MVGHDRTSLLKEGVTNYQTCGARPRPEIRARVRILDPGSACMDPLGRDDSSARVYTAVLVFYIQRCIYTYIRMTFHRYMYSVNYMPGMLSRSTMWPRSLPWSMHAFDLQYTAACLPCRSTRTHERRCSEARHQRTCRCPKMISNYLQTICK
jgi:hypothetical protein